MKSLLLIISVALFISSCATAPKNNSADNKGTKVEKTSAEKKPVMVRAAKSAYGKLDAECLSILKGVENRMKAPTYLRVTDNGSEDKLKRVKLNNSYYAHVEGNEWEKLSLVPSEGYEDILKGIKSGKASFKNCKSLGEETLDGKQVNVLSYDFLMKLSPKFELTINVRQYTGKIDGLPYKEVETAAGKSKETTYNYDKASIPKVK